MDFNDTPDEAAYRDRARNWLAETAPAHVLPPGGAKDDDDLIRRARAWQRALYDGGFAGITLDRALGGQGGSVIEAVVFAEEAARYRLPTGPFTSIGLGMALPVIARHGSEEQRNRFIEATLKGEILWCQLFSEPGAGSDLAALRTKGVRDGNAWIINGQKVWSTYAHQADWGILVVRTDASVPKHKGLTFFVVDMRAPGIELRPIRQISGASDFTETFLTDVAIPDENRIGAEGEGWACCMTVLTGERLAGGGGSKEQVLPLVRYVGETPGIDESAILSLADALAQERGLKFLEARLRTMVSRGENPGAMTGMVKLSYANRQQRALGLAMELRGFAALAAEEGDDATRQLHADYIYSAVMRIAGGADEVLRNQIAERILGMPGEIRADKDIPFDRLR